MIDQRVTIRWLGTQDYQTTWDAMRAFTDHRHDQTIDEIWLLEHPPVFTQGQSGKAAHLINPGDIPVIQTDRGGQVTYHGPGQLMIYLLVDVRRKQLTVRKLVTCLEQSIIALLAQFNVPAFAKKEAPGIYISSNEKIGSIGLRIRRGCTYHGIAFNVTMDLSPFSRINPCGFSTLKMTHLAAFCDAPLETLSIAKQYVPILCTHLAFSHPFFTLSAQKINQVSL